MDRDEYCKLVGLDLTRRAMLAIAYSQPRQTDWHEGERARQAAKAEHLRRVQSLASAVLDGNETLILESVRPLEAPISEEDIANAKSVKSFRGAVAHV